MGVGQSRPMVTEREQIGETIEFPEKVYVLITTHGRINFTPPSTDTTSKELGRINFYRVPDGITVKKINPIRPGQCNFISKNYLNEILDYMKYAIDNEFLPKNNLIQQVEIKNKYGKRILQEEKQPEQLILDFLRKTNPAVENLRKRIKSNKEKDYEILSDMRSYVHSPKYFLDVYSPGMRAPNKYYSYSNKDKFDPAKFIIKEIGRNNKIFDVMNILKQVIYDTDSDGQELTTTYTSEIDIVDFFKNHGVKELILIDLSCSVFANYQGDMPTPRSARLFRKRITTQKFGGLRRRNKHTHKYKHKR